MLKGETEQTTNPLSKESNRGNVYVKTAELCSMFLFLRRRSKQLFATVQTNRIHRRFESSVTFQGVEGVAAQAEGAITDDAAETLAVEEVALGAEPLHHVNPLGAEVAGVAAPEARRKVFTAETLRDGGRGGGSCCTGQFRHVAGCGRRFTVGYFQVKLVMKSGSDM